MRQKWVRDSHSGRATSVHDRRRSHPARAVRQVANDGASKVLRARALVLAADGVANHAIGEQVGVNPNSVRLWRRRFEEERIDGVGRVARVGVESRRCPREPWPRWWH